MVIFNQKSNKTTGSATEEAPLIALNKLDAISVKTDC